VGEYFYHSNLKTPRWLGLVIQRSRASLRASPARRALLQISGDLTSGIGCSETFRDTDEFRRALRVSGPTGREARRDAVLLRDDV
jgi:hypothetical protein